MSLEFIVELKDKVSEGADSAAESLEGLKEGISGSSLELAAMGTAAAVAVAGIAIVGASLYEGAKASLEAREEVEKLTAQLGALSGGKQSGEEVLGVLRQIEKQVPQNEATVASWAKSLMAAGQTDMGKLSTEIKAIASSEALVEGGGEKVRAMFAKLHEAGMKGTKLRFSAAMLAGTGVTEQELMAKLGMTPKQLDLAKKQGTLSGDRIADAMAAVLATKGGPVLAQQMDTIPAMMNKAKDSISRLFEDVDISPFTDGLKSLMGLFDQNTASGKTLKLLATTIFSGLFSIVGKVFPYIRQGFLQLAILALKGYIAVQPLVTKFKEFWATHTMGDKLVTLLKGIGIVVGVVAVAMAAAGAVAFLFANWLTIVGVAAGLALAYVVGFVVDSRAAIMGWVTGAATAASDFVMGLVNGIKNGAGFVIDAVKHLGSSMLGGIKSMLGISSPSVEMMKIGGHMTAGLEAGVDKGAPSAQGALQSATTPPAVAAAPAAAGGSRSVVNHFQIDVHGGGTAEDNAKAFRVAIADFFEEMGLMQGA